MSSSYSSSSSSTISYHTPPGFSDPLRDLDNGILDDSSVQIISPEIAFALRLRRESGLHRNKRRKVSERLYKPVYIKVEPDGQVKTHSVITQWKPFPQGQSFVKWNTLVKKLELRSRHIDIYRAEWKEVDDYDLDQHPDLCQGGRRFVNWEGGSQDAESLADRLEQHVLETQCAEYDFVSARDHIPDPDEIPDQVDSCQLMAGYISDLE